jgi:diguanylate cyclase (GGDEF)-like protein
MELESEFHSNDVTRHRSETPDEIRRVFGPLQVILAFCLCGTMALAMAQQARTAQIDREYGRRLSRSDTEISMSLATVRDTTALVSTARRWVHGEVSRRDVQVRRALLATRLATSSVEGRTAGELAGSAYLEELSRFDDVFGAAPPGTLSPADQAPWSTGLAEPLEELERLTRRLVTNYQASIDDTLRSAAEAHEGGSARESMLLIAAVMFGLALGTSTWLSIRRAYREARALLVAERRTLDRATAELQRIGDFEAEQSALLELIIEGPPLRVVLERIAAMASRFSGDRPFRLRLGSQTVVAGDPSHGGDPVAEWRFEPEGLDGRSGVLELLAAEPGQEPFEVQADLAEVAQRCADLALIAVNGQWARDELVHQASHDPLTGLFNRSYVQRRLEEALERRKVTGDEVALVFCDLNRFKLVNDSLGHKAGDQLLVHIAGWLSRTIGSCSWSAGASPAVTTLARLGGDEFVILCESSDALHDALALAIRLQNLQAHPLSIDGVETYVDVSVGVALSAPEMTSGEQLLRNADIAMYRAKESGQGVPVVYGGDLEADVALQLRTDTELRRAFERGEFRLQLQPIVRLDDLHTVGFEALVRWEHPVRGLLGPDQFLARVEELGLIGRLDSWVRREALQRFAEHWRAQPDGSYLSVNVAEREFRQPSFVEDVLSDIAGCGIPNSQLVLELSEDAFVDLGEHGDVLERLRRAGIRIAMDDFGTGYSSLFQIQRLPVDIVKIDRGLIVGLADTDGRARGVLGGLLDVVRALGLDLVVEGVEKEAERQVLLELGCPNGQGYLFGRPGTPLEVLRSSRAVPSTAGRPA